MMEIVFKIGGKEINPGSLKNPLTAALLFERTKSIKRAVGNLKCSEHGEQPVIILAGRNVENLTCEVGGCCNNLVKGVKKKISFLF